MRIVRFALFLLSSCNAVAVAVAVASGNGTSNNTQSINPGELRLAQAWKGLDVDTLLVNRITQLRSRLGIEEVDVSNAEMAVLSQKDMQAMAAAATFQVENYRAGYAYIDVELRQKFSDKKVIVIDFDSWEDIRFDTIPFGPGNHMYYWVNFPVFCAHFPNSSMVFAKTRAIWLNGLSTNQNDGTWWNLFRGLKLLSMVDDSALNEIVDLDTSCAILNGAWASEQVFKSVYAENEIENTVNVTGTIALANLKSEKNDAASTYRSFLVILVFRVGFGLLYLYVACVCIGAFCLWNRRHAHANAKAKSKAVGAVLLVNGVTIGVLSIFFFFSGYAFTGSMPEHMENTFRPLFFNCGCGLGILIAAEWYTILYRSNLLLRCLKGKKWLCTLITGALTGIGSTCVVLDLLVMIGLMFGLARKRFVASILPVVIVAITSFVSLAVILSATGVVLAMKSLTKNSMVKSFMHRRSSARTSKVHDEKNLEAQSQIETEDVQPQDKSINRTRNLTALASMVNFLLIFMLVFGVILNEEAIFGYIEWHLFAFGLIIVLRAFQALTQVWTVCSDSDVDRAPTYLFFILFGSAHG